MREVHHRTAGTVHVVGSPVRLSERGTRAHAVADFGGAHARSPRRYARLADAEIDALAAAGVFGSAPREGMMSDSHSKMDVNEVFRGGGRSVEWLDEINKASIVMLDETGLVTHALAVKIAQGIAKVIDDERETPPTRTADYLDYEPRLIAVAGPTPRGCTPAAAGRTSPRRSRA